MKILVADDEHLARERLLRLLDKLLPEAHCVQAAGGREALIQVERYAPELVLLDIRMPEMDGNELVSTIRTTPKLRMLPVLMLTGSDDKADLLQNLGAGVSDYCQKSPDDYAEFLARVRNLLAMKELQDEVERASRTDALTSLANRRHGVERLTEEIGRSTRYERELCVAFGNMGRPRRSAAPTIVFYQNHKKNI